MANKPQGPDGSKSTNIQIRCTPVLKERIKNDADEHQMEISEFIRYLYHSYKEFIQRKKD